MYHVRPNLVVGFHGCDEVVCNSLLNNPNRIKISRERYDWLGNDKTHIQIAIRNPNCIKGDFFCRGRKGHQLGFSTTSAMFPKMVSWYLIPGCLMVYKKNKSRQWASPGTYILSCKSRRLHIFHGLVA